MKKIIKLRRLSILVLSVTLLSMLSMVKHQVYHTPEWKAPISTDTIRNPLKGDTESIAEGKKIYALHCIACHGEKGVKIQNQSDEAIFSKITNGNKPMPAFGDVLSIKQRWQVVNYVRTLITKFH
jgi:cytochrome c